MHFTYQDVSPSDVTQIYQLATAVATAGIATATVEYMPMMSACQY